MTIDEAIRHCEEVAEAQEGVIKSRKIYVEIKGLTPLDECRKIAADHRQLAEWLTELKEARKLLTSTKYKVEHEEWDMHGEHYIGDYALCPNCDKCFTNIYNGKAAPVVTFCPDCGQKIDWS